ncbi:MAG TPA: hypothetical protein VHA75_02125 [Rugosimonospora sp.]|nr:hypothetical protein [Rugosimonospora sp.]
MHSGSERDWLKAELAESITDLSQFGWSVETGYPQRTFQEFAHGRHRNPLGLDESMVTARFLDDGRLEVKRYALPRGVAEWVECDREAFLGFLAEGESGLANGDHFTRPTYCPCDKKRHRSLIRGEAFARKVAQEAGTDALQRAYRCDWNARSVHLSSKKNGEPIPGAFVVLAEGWNS